MKKKHTVLKILGIGLGIVVCGVVAKYFLDRKMISKIKQQDMEEDVCCEDDTISLFQEDLKATEKEES